MKEIVKKIAKLSAIELKEDEVEKLESQFNQIINYVSKIEEIDLADTEPLFSLAEEYNIMRKDEVQDPLPIEEVLRNAPKKNEQFFKVPKVRE